MDKKDTEQKQSQQTPPKQADAGHDDKTNAPSSGAGSGAAASGGGQPRGGQQKSRRQRSNRGGQQKRPPNSANDKPSHQANNPEQSPEQSQGKPKPGATSAGSDQHNPKTAADVTAENPANQKPTTAQKGAKPGTSSNKNEAAEKPQDKQAAAVNANPAAEKGSDANSSGQPPASNPRDNEPKASSAAVGVLSIWLVLVFLLLAGSLGGASWYGWQLLEEKNDRIDLLQQDLTEQHQTLDQQAGEIAQEIAQVNEVFAERDAELKAQMADLGQSLTSQREALSEQIESRNSAVESRIDHVANNLQTIEDRLARGEVAWKTAEIGFLLTRAQERLVIARDPAGASVALALADQRIAELARPHWLGLRDKIATALGEIETARDFDRIGAALSMRRLGDQVDQWPLQEETVVEKAGRDDDELTEPSRPPIDESLPWYERTAKQAWRWVTDQFHVEQQARQVEPVSRFETDREMRIWLTAVRESLLARDSSSLERALHEADYWLTTHYNLDDAGPNRLAEQLARIEASAGLSEYPDLEALFTAWEAADRRERENARRYDGEEAQ